MNIYTQKRPKDEDIESSLAEAGLDVSSIFFRCMDPDEELSGVEVYFFEDPDTGKNGFSETHIDRFEKGVCAYDELFDDEEIEAKFAHLLAKRSGLDVLVWPHDDSYDILEKHAPDGTITRVELDEDTREIIWESEPLSVKALEKS